MQHMNGLASKETFLFEGFRFDRAESCLHRENGLGAVEPLLLGSRASSLLGLLVERPGTLVTKDEIFAAVWPGTAVEEANLTVQVSTLRRVLDRDRERGSCIQTIPGRGYRFVVPVTRAPSLDVMNACRPATNGVADPLIEEGSTEAPGGVEQVPQPHPTGLQRERGPLRYTMIVVVVGVLCLGAVVAAAFNWRSLSFWEPEPAPRLSLVVLPFNNLDHDPQTALIADSFTEVLTDDLAHTSDSLVIIPSAAIGNSKTFDSRQISRKLGVRYKQPAADRPAGPCSGPTDQR